MRQWKSVFNCILICTFRFLSITNLYSDLAEIDQFLGFPYSLDISVSKFVTWIEFILREGHTYREIDECVGKDTIRM